MPRYYIAEPCPLNEFDGQMMTLSLETAPSPKDAVQKALKNARFTSEDEKQQYISQLQVFELNLVSHLPNEHF